jgi:uncharacterized membrane protein YkoI
MSFWLTMYTRIMKRIRAKVVAAITVWVAAILSLDAAQSAQSAQDRMLFAEMASTAFQSGGLSLDQAISQVQSKYGARVMRANTVEEDGRKVHYIRLMTPDRSRVWTVRVDAATGREF